MLSLGSLPLGATSCHVMRTLKQPSGEAHAMRDRGLLLTATRIRLEADPPAPVKPLEDCSLADIFNLMRHPNQNYPAKPQLNLRNHAIINIHCYSNYDNIVI